MTLETQFLKMTCAVCGREYFEETFGEIAKLFQVTARCAECWRSHDADIAARQIEEEEQRTQMRKAEKLDDARIPARYIDYDLTKGNPKLYNWVVLNSRSSIWLSGPTGCTKTRAVCAVGASEVLAGKSVQFWRTSEMCRRLAGLYSEKIKDADRMINSLCSVRILILDDLGKEVLTDRQGEIIFEIIDRRYESNKQIWVTTNQNGEDLISRLGSDRGTPAMRRLREMCEVWNG